MPLIRDDAAVRPLLTPPRLRTLEDGEERHASWLELFFDLVFVVAVTELAHQLVLDHSLAGFGEFAGLYLPAFIAWQGFTFYADRFDTDDLAFRVVILLGMLAIAALAIQIPDVTHGASTGFALAYIVLRSLMITLYLRSYLHVPEARPLIVRYAGAYSLGVALWIVSLGFGSPTRFVFWGVALAWEYAQPTLVRRLHQTIPVHTSHVPERFALFTLIVLGESVVAVALGTADSNWQASSAAAAALGFLVAASLWWVYYGDGTTLSLSRTSWSIIVFTHIHIPLLAALTAVSAGITVAIRDAGLDQLDAGARWSLCGGAAVYLVCLTEAQLATVQGLALRTKVARFATAAMLVALAAASGAAAPLVVTVVVTALLVGLVTLELLSASHVRAIAEAGRASRAAPAG